MANMALLKKLAAAEATGRGKYFEAGGKYRLRIDKLALEEKTEGLTFIAEHTITKNQSTGPNNLKYTNGAMEKVEVPLHPVGDNRNYVKTIGGGAQKEKMALGDIRAYLEALLPDLKGAPEADFIATLELLTGPKQVAKGWEIDADVFQKAQKEDKTKSFTHIRWEHVARAPETKPAA